jgi:hypothetical protein
MLRAFILMMLTFAGRGTLGRVAFDTREQRVCYLKDSWRAAALRPEWEHLHQLNEAGVPHIPTFVCGGEIKGLNQTTRSHEMDRTRIVRHHQRFLMKEVGRELEKFASSRDVISAVKDAITGTVLVHVSATLAYLLL